MSEVAKGEILCPTCSTGGKEQIISKTKTRIWHPGRHYPCLAPEGYEPVQEEEDRVAP